MLSVLSAVRIPCIDYSNMQPLPFSEYCVSLEATSSSAARGNKLLGFLVAGGSSAATIACYGVSS
jgi:hypothetical protein